MDAGGSYNFDVFPSPLSLSSKHVLDRGVHGEEQSKRRRARYDV